MTTTPPLPSPTGIANDPDWLFAELSRRLAAAADVGLEKRLDDHVRAKCGYQSMQALKQGNNQRQKVEIFGELLSAVILKDFSKLMLPPPDISVIVIDGSSPQEEVHKRNQDTALAKLIKLLTTPGITAQVKVEVTIIQKGNTP